ncbi:MAG: hypothetical protein LBN43_09095 [Oscillospiraceae bacterium]|jgi:hypothetical protein|nr:hypothetical protein [Oscillospiraceae bacterium]
MKRKISLILLPALILLLFAACIANQAPPNLKTYVVGDGSQSAGSTTPRPSAGTNEAKPEEITEEEYEQLVEGTSTYEETVAIIGGEGREMKPRGGIIPYTWVGYAPMSKTVTMNFRDGVLVSKDPQGSNHAVGQSNTPAPVG